MTTTIPFQAKDNARPVRIMDLRVRYRPTAERQRRAALTMLSSDSAAGEHRKTSTWPGMAAFCREMIAYNGFESAQCRRKKRWVTDSPFAFLPCARRGRKFFEWADIQKNAQGTHKRKGSRSRDRPWEAVQRTMPLFEIGARDQWD